MHSAWIVLLALPVFLFADLRTIDGLPRSMPHAVVVLPLLVAFGAFTLRRHAATIHRAAAWWAAIGALALSACVPPHVAELARVSALAFALAGVFVVASAAAWCAFALLAAGVVHWLLPLVLASVDPAPLAGPILAFALRALGVDAVATASGIAVGPHGDGALAFATSWSQLGVPELLAWWVGAAVLAWACEAHSTRGRELIWLSAAAGTAAVVRFAAFVVGVLQGAPLLIFADPTWQAILLAVPLGLVLWVRGSPRAMVVRDLAVVPGFTRRFSAACVGLAMLGLAYFAPGRQHADSVRVAIDDFHSRWERTDLPLDRAIFGTRAVYNYAEWVRGLSELYGEVDSIREPITSERLADIDVLILKTPTEPPTVGEVEAITRFVHDGGGLFAVGDHTDIFAMNTILSACTRRFGIEFRADAVFEHEYVGGQVIDSRSFPPHPVASAMRPMHWMTSCSLDLDWPARPIVWTRSGYADAPDYGKYTFFGNDSLDPGEPLAPFIQVATAEYGAGRVLAFGDSTTLSNFSIFFPGIRELAFGGVEWLATRETFPLWRACAVVMGLLLLAFGARRSAGHPFLWPAASVCAAAVSLGVAHWNTQQSCTSWQRTLAPRETVFDCTVTAGRLPLWHEAHGLADEFWNLFLAFQRSGDVMRASLGDEDPFTGRRAILIWPCEPIDNEFVKRAVAFVERGGELYIFDDRVDDYATRRLLEPFGLSIEPLDPHAESLDLAAEFLGDGRAMMDFGEHAAQVRGGDPLFWSSTGAPLAAVQEHGLGRVIVCGLAECFSDAALGQPTDVPDASAFARVQLLYSIIDAARGTQL